MHLLFTVGARCVLNHAVVEEVLLGARNTQQGPFVVFKDARMIHYFIDEINS
jgi:hypothetical protein